MDREISRGKRVKWVNLFELDGVFDTLFIHLSQCVKLSDSREMEELKRREISIIFYRHRCNRLIFFARYSEGILYLFQRVCTCIYAESQRRKHWKGMQLRLFLIDIYMEYCNTYIAANTRVCALVGGFVSTNKIVLHRVTASRERFTLLVLYCIPSE